MVSGLSSPKNRGIHPFTFERVYFTTNPPFFQPLPFDSYDRSEFTDIIKRMPEIIVFIIALVIAIRGADWIGRSSIVYAKKLGLPHFVIGATLVSVATALPGLAVAAIAGTIDKDPQLALGSVLGSPLINLGIILGIFFFFSKSRPKIGYYSRAINIFIVIAILLLVISVSSDFGGLVSWLLIALGLLFLLLEFTIGKKSQTLWDKIESRFESATSIFSFHQKRESLLEFIFGAIFLAVGSYFLVNSSLSIAGSLKVPELFLSITLVALSTSFPELITMITSLVQKRDGLAFGNLVGASVIDLTIGVGLATTVNHTAIAYPANYLIFLPMLLMGAICLLALWKKIPLMVIGGLLLSTAFIFLLLFSLHEIV